MIKKEFHPIGTKRIKSIDLNLYEKNKKDWILIINSEKKIN
jgi:hypothetical protein